MPPAEFSTEEVGTAFANAGDYEQREVLIAMANAVDKMAWNNGSWPDQCRAIVEGYNDSGLSQSQRIRIASMLGCLIDHLNEPVRETT